MSYQQIRHIISRIAAASEDSPIAVFADDPDHMRLRSVFGATTGTKSEIDAGNEDFVGFFHKNQDMIEVRARLQFAERIMRQRQ